ncbi:hypothetical protein QFZ35_003025 [Arthrobacter ulcerisalmonis]|nr:hypothetical protein [Arthrobacter ulcerisalmonis]
MRPQYVFSHGMLDVALPVSGSFTERLWDSQENWDVQ